MPTNVSLPYAFHYVVTDMQSCGVFVVEIYDDEGLLLKVDSTEDEALTSQLVAETNEFGNFHCVWETNHGDSQYVYW